MRGDASLALGLGSAGPLDAARFLLCYVGVCGAVFVVSLNYSNIQRRGICAVLVFKGVSLCMFAFVI